MIGRPQKLSICDDDIWNTQNVDRRPDWGAQYVNSVNRIKCWRKRIGSLGIAEKTGDIVMDSSDRSRKSICHYILPSFNMCQSKVKIGKMFEETI
jgi:hypothetical protein